MHIRTPGLANRLNLTTTLLLAGPLAVGPLRAQEALPIEAMASWVAVDGATGYELRSAPLLASALPEWSVDPWGNVVTRIGSGMPRRVVACALDRPSYAVSQITQDGYLRVHRIGGGPDHPLWDQAFEAQQVRILTRAGPVAGVVARSNGHFAFQHQDETAVVRADDLWIDVGAASAAEVAELGIGLLDPVGRHLPPWHFAGEVAGPDVGRRVGCGVVVALAEATRRAPTSPGETLFVLSSQEAFGWVGLSSLIARHGTFEQIFLLAPGEEEGGLEARPASSLGRFGEVLAAAGVETVTWLAPAVHSAGSHMERIELEEAEALLSRASEALGRIRSEEAGWVAAPVPIPLRNADADPSLQDVASLLTDLVELHGVPGHEWAVRRRVLEALPAWARELAVVDDMGNVVVEVGPDGDTTVFMAHMDEVGYEVESISPAGTVTLRQRGGATTTAWEGQTALLHFDPPGAPSMITGTGADTDVRWKQASISAAAETPIRGVFLTRDEADEKQVSTLYAWFGMDGVELEARGIRPGAAVTSHKEGLRLGATRFTARSLDDRAGTTALLLAINALEPSELRSKVIFAWSVGEEGGLVGAGALARRYGTTTRRIFSVDTFVSSDTPLESPHFAYAPLGQGPVLRAIENSSVSPDRERTRVTDAAAAAGIPLQMGLTQGGTDGTRFTFWGAPNQGLSWPGRYSHSPGEVLDLRDLRRLSELILAVAMAGEG